MSVKASQFCRICSLFFAAALAAASCVFPSAASGESPEGTKLALWPDRAPIGNGQFEAENASITFYPAQNPNAAAIVICPGGGYGSLVSEPEGRQIANWLKRHGIAGIVLEYRLPKGRPFVPLLDAQRAIRTTRANVAKWQIDPARVGIMGFSAGGHLAATACTHFDAGNLKAPDPIDRMSCRPDFAILVYPVITMTDKGHGGSRDNLLGPDPKPDLIDLFSNEKQVTEKTPPVFLTHAKDDVVVVPDNSRAMHKALKAHKVPTEYLELPSGGHGLNGYQGPQWDAWQRASLEWLAKREISPGK